MPPAIYSKKDNRREWGPSPKVGFPHPSLLGFGLVCFLAGGAWRASEENEKGLSGQGSSCPSGLSLNPGNGQLKCFNVIKQSPAQRLQIRGRMDN